MNDLEELLTSNRVVSEVLSAEEALPVDEALRCATSLAQAVRRMHQEGAVCGCLDPDHIVWNKNGVKLVQNGAGGPAPSLTPYLSPEQVRGETADARSDVFAFGAIVYELLSGCKAHPARDPEELKNEILERSPAPLAGVPEEISSLVSRCLEKRREDRWQRMNSVLIELKLANATARQAHSASEWKERVASLRSQIAGQDGRLTAYQSAQESADAELRQSIARLEEKAESQGTEIAGIRQTLAAIQESIAGLQKGAQLHAKAIESIEAATSQTDEVVEHVVEAFGMVHRSMVERGEAKILLVSRNGN
jgi:serine/threonine protein kinase